MARAGRAGYRAAVVAAARGLRAGGLSYPAHGAPTALVRGQKQGRPNGPPEAVGGSIEAKINSGPVNEGLTGAAAIGSNSIFR